MPTPPLNKNPERYYEIEAMVADGAPITTIMRELHVDFYTIKKYFPQAGSTGSRGKRLTLKDLDPEKYRKMALMVASDCSLNEIMRTLGVDHRTIKNAFPNAGWKKGSNQHKEAVALGRKMREIEKKEFL